MEEIITINGEKYKRIGDEVKEYELYSEIKYKDLDWYVLKDRGKYVRLLLKGVLDEDRIKKYVDDDWYRNENEVRHTDCVRGPFRWKDSYIRNVVLHNFKEDLGFKGSVSLLTKLQAENLPDEVRSCGYYYWTKTNASDSTDKYSYAYAVNSSGNVGCTNAYYEYGVRPVIEISKSEIESV